MSRPTGLHSWLYERLQDLAAAAEQRGETLEKENADLVARKAKNDAELAKLRGADSRRYTFEPMISDQYQCPNCWLRDGVQSPLNTDGGDDKSDFFRCRRCGHEFSKPE